jgi:hypothetical protein
MLVLIYCNSEMRFLRSKLEDIHNQTKTTNGKVINETQALGKRIKILLKH